MAHAIIRLGGRQFRVEEGEQLLVDRLPFAEGADFTPDVLAIDVDGDLRLDKADIGDGAVTARVTEHLRGPKIVIGKHRQRSGYRRRNGFRASLSRVTIESIASTNPKRRKRAATRRATAEKAPAPKAGKRSTKE